MPFFLKICFLARSKKVLLLAGFSLGNMINCFASVFMSIIYHKDCEETRIMYHGQYHGNLVIKYHRCVAKGECGCPDVIQNREKLHHKI